MIIDMRVYTDKPGRYREFLKRFEQDGFRISSSMLGVTIGLFTASSETVNQTIHCFAYEDHDDRDRCRNKYLNNSEKQAFTNGEEGADGCIRVQESTILVPTLFSPLQDRNLDNPILKAPCGRRILELNTYTCKPGCLNEALKTVENKLYPASKKQVHWTLAYFTADSGRERIFELRAYETRQERTNANIALQKDLDYHEAYKELCSYLNDAESKILEAMPMSPLQ